MEAHSTSEELLAVRKLLLGQIAAAETLFPNQTSAVELQNVRAGLRSVEELIADRKSLDAA